MLQGIKKIFEGLLFSLGLGTALCAALNLFRAGLSSVLGQGAVQLSGAESWIWSKLAVPGVIGPFEMAALATIAGVVLLILLLILGLLRILLGVIGVLSASKNAVFGSAKEPDAGRPGLAFALGIVATLIVIAILTGAVKAVLGFIGGLVASASVATVGGASALFVAKLVCASLLIFGVVGFFASLTLLAALVLRRVS